MKLEIPEELKKEAEKKGGWEKLKKSLPEDDIKMIAMVMKALSDEIRLSILYALFEQRMCVCMIVDLVKCPYSKCSYHIAKLKDAGLIKAVKRGNYLIYSLTKFGRSIVKHFNKYKPEEVIK